LYQNHLLFNAEHDPILWTAAAFVSKHSPLLNQISVPKSLECPATIGHSQLTSKPNLLPSIQPSSLTSFLNRTFFAAIISHTSNVFHLPTQYHVKHLLRSWVFPFKAGWLNSHMLQIFWKKEEEEYSCSNEGRWSRLNAQTNTQTALTNDEKRSSSAHTDLIVRQALSVIRSSSANLSQHLLSAGQVFSTTCLQGCGTAAEKYIYITS
jgi:hypothetical protein